jgi:hypothetical protein
MGSGILVYMNASDNIKENKFEITDIDEGMISIIDFMRSHGHASNLNKDKLYRREECFKRMMNSMDEFLKHLIRIDRGIYKFNHI